MKIRMSDRGLAFACAAILASPSAIAAELPNGVAAGDVTSGSGVLWARAAVAGKLRFDLSRRADFSGASAYLRVVQDPAVPAKVTLSGLKPGRTYYYRATDAAGNRSAGIFRTPEPACADSGFRMGVSGDWRPELRPYPAISNVPERDLDVFVMLGDTIYAENYSEPEPTASTLEQYRAKHEQTLAPAFGLNTWPAARASTAVLATIDDHEVINDFAGGASPASDADFDQTGRFINETARYRAGIQAFRDYMPVRELKYGHTGDPRTQGKPRLYRARAYGNAAAVFVLDARSFRDQALPPVQDFNDPQQVGTFLAASFDPSRTMLGRAQVEDLKRGLLLAEQAGITWKFVAVPEPIQNLGLLAAADRFEGYAAERTALLGFIEQSGIRNVLFVTADIHGTITNNLTYQTGPFTPQRPLPSLEVSTGAVAFSEPFGQTVIGLAAGLGLVTPGQKAFYDTLPIAPDADLFPNDKDDFLRAVIDQQLLAFGYDPLGLLNSPLPATLEAGDDVAAHTYGWTEFEVDPATRDLVVTTYGIPPYSLGQLRADPAGVTGRVPAVTSRIRVQPDLAASADDAARARACQAFDLER